MVSSLEGGRERKRKRERGRGRSIIEEVWEGKEGASPWVSIFSRGAISTTEAMESSRDPVEFSRKKAFCVYKTISRVNMFEWATKGKKFWLICVLESVTFCGNGRVSRCNPLLAVVKNVLIRRHSACLEGFQWDRGGTNYNQPIRIQNTARHR